MTTVDTAVGQLRRWALCLAERGWRVFPVRPGGKVPALHGRKGCTGTGVCARGHQGWEQRATTDPERIVRCWAGRAWNIGIACGPSGLLVVDCDMPGQGGRGRSGEEAVRRLAEQAGQPLPETYTVATPSGGRHYYFRLPVGYRNTARDLHPLIDTRAAGGQVVAPGSITPTGAYRLLNDTDPAELPGWLVQALAPRPAQAHSALHETAAVHLDRYTTAALRDECDRVATARCGRQNQTLYEAALALGRLVAGDALPAPTARDALHAAMSRLPLSRPHEPWLPDQIDATIDSAFRAAASRPRRIARRDGDVA